jgi:hypothetical protein
VLLARIAIVGRFWRPRPFETPGEKPYQLSTAFVLELPQVVFQKRRIEQLASELEQWSLGSQEISFELSDPSEIHESFLLELSAYRADTLKGSQCSITYSAEAFEKGKWRFLVDQSCIRLFFEELSSSLANLGA